MLKDGCKVVLLKPELWLFGDESSPIPGPPTYGI